MTEEKLTKSDRRIINLDLKIFYIIGLVFLVAVILFISLMYFGGTIIGFQPKDGFITRGVYIFSVFFALIFLVWTSYFKHYVDLIKGLKISLLLNQFQVMFEKDKAYLISSNLQYGRIEIYEGLLKFIDATRPLKIELAKHSKSILFISHDSNNYLDNPL